MTKNDNAHALRLCNSLAVHCGNEAAEALTSEYPLSKSAGVEKKFEWANNICRFLNERYDNETVMSIRMDCACGPETGKCKKVKEMFDKSLNPEAFVDRVNKLNLGYTLEYDGENYFLIYPRCYCSCVKNIPKNVPEAWCYCTIGYTKKLFEFVFEGEVEAELINSVKLGADNCRIRVKKCE